MIWLVLLSENADGDFEARLRTFATVMALFALICTWLWLYLRVKSRMGTPLERPPEPENKPPERE